MKLYCEVCSRIGVSVSHAFDLYIFPRVSLPLLPPSQPPAQDNRERITIPPVLTAPAFPFSHIPFSFSSYFRRQHLAVAARD